MVDQTIVNFIKTALSKGYSDDYIINGLKSKNWPLPAINEALSVAKSQMKSEGSPQKVSPQPQPQPTLQPTPASQLTQKTQVSIQPQKQNIEIKPKQDNVHKKQINLKAYSLPTLAFLGIFLLITFTFSVYFYMDGVIHYEITDQNGITKTKYCLQQDCSDLKTFALKKATDNLVISIISGLILTALIVVGYLLVPLNLKSKLFWGVNILYLLAVLVMAAIWFIFNFSA